MEIRQTENARCVPPDMKKGSVVGLLTLTGKYWVDKFQSRRYEVACKCGNVSFKSSVFIRDSKCCSKKRHTELRRTCKRHLVEVKKKYKGKIIRDHLVEDVVKSSKSHVLILKCVHCGKAIRRSKSKFLKEVVGGCKCVETKIRREAAKEAAKKVPKVSVKKAPQDRPRNKNMIGRRFGKLTVVQYAGMTTDKHGNKHSTFKCICDCGGEWTGNVGRLTSGSRKYCDKEISDNNRKKARNTNKKKRRKPNFGMAKILREENKTRFSRYSSRIYRKYEGVCQACKTMNPKKKSHAHHMIPVNKKPELCVTISNGILLCESCHMGFHTQYGFSDFNPKDVFDFIKSVRRCK